MAAPPDPGGDITRLICEHRDGDPAARDRLIDFTYRRFKLLTRQMLDDFPALRRWEQTDDVLHRAIIRLWDSLKAVPLQSSVHFLRLGGLQIRRELHDLMRHHFGPHGAAAHHDTGRARAISANTDQPISLVDYVDRKSFDEAQRAEIHEAVALLTEELQEVVALHFYQGLSQPDVARLLGVDVRTVKRRWSQAKRLLCDRIVQLPPRRKRA